MSDKKIILFTILALLSVAAGGVLGLLDIFGFVDGRHGLSLTFLALSIIVVYFSVITVFVLDFADSNRIATPFVVSSLLFGVTFFLMNLNVILSIFCTVLYLCFLLYAYKSSRSRAKNQIRFKPHDIFLPVLRNSILYLLILISAIAFTQSRQHVSRNDLIQPGLIKSIAKPAVFTLNNQLNGQIQSQLNAVPEEVRVQSGDEKIVRLILEKTLESMAEGEKGTIYGFKPDEIPIEEIAVSESGNIDMAPMIDRMLPEISAKLNIMIQKYALFAPFLVALLTFLILQPFMLPVNLVESFLTILIFKILVSTGFIKIDEEQRSVQKLHL